MIEIWNNDRIIKRDGGSYKQDHLYVVVVDGKFQLPFLLNPKKHINQILTPKLRIPQAGDAISLMPIDDAIQDHVELVAHRLEPALSQAQGGHNPRRGEQIRDLKACDDLSGFEDELEERLIILHDAATGGAASGGVGVQQDLLRQIHDPSGRFPQRIDQPRRLVAPDGLEQLHHLRAQKLVDAELPHLAPVAAVGAEGDVARAVHHDIGERALPPIGEDGVEIFEHFFD